MLITSVTQKIENFACSASFFYKFAEKYYADVVEKEVVLANITASDRVLCIGGGICPFSAVLLHRRTGAKITVIDNCRDCVLKAQRFIARSGLSKQITVLHQDGRNSGFSFANYTVVHFALQVCPLNNVFENVESHVSAGTKLLVRASKSGLKKFYSRLPEFLSLCPKTTHSSARNIGSTLLYIKAAESRAARVHEKTA